MAFKYETCMLIFNWMWLPWLFKKNIQHYVKNMSYSSALRIQQNSKVLNKKPTISKLQINNYAIQTLNSYGLINIYVVALCYFRNGIENGTHWFGICGGTQPNWSMSDVAETSQLWNLDRHLSVDIKRWEMCNKNCFKRCTCACWSIHIYEQWAMSMPLKYLYFFFKIIRHFQLVNITKCFV